MAEAGLSPDAFFNGEDTPALLRFDSDRNHEGVLRQHSIMDEGEPRESKQGRKKQRLKRFPTRATWWLTNSLTAERTEVVGGERRVIYAQESPSPHWAAFAYVEDAALLRSVGRKRPVIAPRMPLPSGRGASMFGRQRGKAAQQFADWLDREPHEGETPITPSRERSVTTTLPRRPPFEPKWDRAPERGPSAERVCGCGALILNAVRTSCQSCASGVVELPVRHELDGLREAA